MVLPKEKYGGILCDIGSHQVEQFLYYADVKNAIVTKSHVANYNHPQYPELEDFGEAMLVGDNGATNYFKELTGLHPMAWVLGETVGHLY